MRAKAAIGALLVTGLAILTHPAGAHQVMAGILWALGALLAVMLTVLAGWACWAGSRRRARRRTIRDLPPAAREPATAFDRLAAGTYAMPAAAGAGTCSGGCGRPAEVFVSYADGRPPGSFCRPCHADTAASDRRAGAGCCDHGVPPEPDGTRRCGLCDLPAPGAVPAAPDNAPGRMDMSEFES